MDVRIAADRDYDQIRKIWTYCFNEGDSVENCYFDNKYRAENTVVAELDGDVVASIHLNQHTIRLGNKEENVSYVVGVSTLPEARGKGVMKSLMNLSFEEMYKRGQNVSILMPIDFRLYRRFGFENCYDMMEHRIDINDLSSFRIERDFKRAKESNIEDLIDIYNKSNRRLNGYTVRAKKRYDNMFKEVEADGGHIYICSDDKGVYDGYVIYAINEGKFFVREIYFSNTNALKSILAFIYNHNTQANKVVIMEDARNTIGCILKNPKTAESLLKPFMMGRVVNLENCFKNISDYLKSELIYSDCVDSTENVIVSVNDDYLEKNTANYRLSFKSGAYGCDKLEYDEESSDMNLNIKQISQLVFGYKDIDDIVDLYDKDIDEEKLKLLRKIFTKKINHINEYD